jgi:hypothetical protein
MTAPANSPTILEAMEKLWPVWFRDPATWAPWRAFLSALFGLRMTARQRELFRRCTSREEVPAGGFVEAWLAVGRRGGKSIVLALIAVYLAVFRDWRPYLSPGEVGTIKVIATDRRQARVIHRYCRALLSEVPALAALVECRRAWQSDYRGPMGFRRPRRTRVRGRCDADSARRSTPARWGGVSTPNAVG